MKEVALSYKIIVGNIDFGTSGQQIKELFEQVGRVESVGFIRKRVLSTQFPDVDAGTLRTGTEVGGIFGRVMSRIKTPAKFGVVEMATQEEAHNAIERLQGTELPGSGRIIVLSGPHGPGKTW